MIISVLFTLILERVNEEAEKRLRDLETNYQMQVSSMRTTLELVKEQMEREAEDKIQQLREEHRVELGRDTYFRKKSSSLTMLHQITLDFF